VSVLEIALLAVTAVLAVLLVVTTTRLRVARRDIEDLRSGVPRRRLVPRPEDAVRTVVGTAMKVRDHGLSGALRSSIDDLALWADVERPDLARMAAADGTVTILFSDIEGSTELNHRLGDQGWVRLLGRHDRIIEKAVAAHSGHVIKTQGDGFMVAFAEASEAVGAACDVQRRLAGLRPHRGSAVHRDGDLFGRNVAYAARVAAQAEGGEVLVSDTVLAALAEDDHRVLESREAVLKGVPGSHGLHAIDWRR
jgi:adenylate cyclase